MCHRFATVNLVEPYLPSVCLHVPSSFLLFGLQDVAYSLTTSLESGLLDSMDEFVDFYFERLREKLISRNLTPPPASFRSHFDVCWLDYARVVMFGLWRRLSLEQVYCRFDSDSRGVL